MGRPDPIVTESRALGLPTDSTVTPLDAGRALYLLATPPVAGPRNGPRLPDGLRLPPSLPGQPLPPPLTPLPRGWPGIPLNPRAEWGDVPDTAFVLEQALRGFTPAQMAWLRAFDAHPVWAAFHTVATARAVDYYGARFRLPLPERIDASAILRGVGPFEWGHGLSDLSRLAWYNTSRAALRLAERKPEEAERILRETVSVGLRIVYEDPSVAAAVVREGRRALDQLARLTGRTAPGLGRVHDSQSAAPTGIGPDSAPDLGARRPRADILASATDTLRSRAGRYRALWVLSTLPCLNAREMIFGPDPDILAAFDEARRSLARFPSDSARIDALERIATGERPGWTPEALAIFLQERERPLPLRALRWMGHASALVLGAPRFALCFDQILVVF